MSRVLGFRLENWWALFILMPGLAMFGTGWLIPRRDNGRFLYWQWRYSTLEWPAPHERVKY